MIVDLATGQRVEAKPGAPSPAAEHGRRGGLTGGPARAEALSRKERAAIARKAAAARWGTKRRA